MTKGKVNVHLHGTMKKVTIKDIAALVNTSPHTVSKALNNKPGVSQTLREQIKQTARELNYIPNMFGRGLSGKPSNTIGLIIADNTNPAYPVIINGIETRARESDYTIILCNSREELSTEEKLIRVLLEKHVDGVLITPVDHPQKNKNIEILQQLHIPYLLMNRTILAQQHPCMKADNARGAYLAGCYLLDKGHRHILHLTRKYSIIAVEERIRGLQQAFTEKHIPFRAENIYRRCEVTIASAYREMLAILQKRRDFTAVFAFNDMIAFGAMKAVAEYGFRIPEDIAVMGFDNLMFSEVSLVPLTTVDQHLEAIGTLAVDVLLRKIQGEFDGDSPSLPEPSIVERKSA